MKATIPSAPKPLSWAQAQSPADSPFDYLIVGSGAGGGPLACRLARAGKRVLLIEAGPDPKIAGEIHDAPLYHGPSTEDPRLSWEFSVRHYADSVRQAADHKYDSGRDPDQKTGGIFYPRSSGIGGCTAHHAMIVIRPNDQDWDGIADLTNDDSWRARNMQPYFAKFEKCLYIDEYRGFLASIFGVISRLWFALVRFINPKPALDLGGHGQSGWQPTSFISPALIQRILKTDAEFTTVLVKSAFRVIEKSDRLTALLKRYLLSLGVVRSFDPNDVSTRAANPGGGVYLIPLGVGGGDAVDELGDSLKGRRAGVREFILRTQKEFPGNLVVAHDVHVKRVLFDTASPPRAIGVVGTSGQHLYKASPLHQPASSEDISFYVRGTRTVSAMPGLGRAEGGGEVILCGGSFNTPQLLMLSGIGDRAHLDCINDATPTAGRITPMVDLPGVGRNLQDRYEVAVISELREDLKTLDTVSFIPGDPKDKVREEWVKTKEGLYATNGGTLAILQRSAGASGDGADLFTFGVPAAFRGYYWNWSRQLFKPVKDAINDQHNLWTWVILKAYTRNNGGTVRLRSADPFDTPAICFHSFDEGERAAGVKGWEKDVEALVEAIHSVRKINSLSGSPFVRELQPEGYLAQKNEQMRSSGQPEWSLGDWIKNEAWGHHACGTCRIGSDPWTENPAHLNDKHAVLDSHFRVHGVKGLRVVDASVFPRIPGYFILAPILMVSEKAAEVLLRGDERPEYPQKVRDAEAAAIHRRRERAYVDSQNQLIPLGQRRPVDIPCEGPGVGVTADEPQPPTTLQPPQNVIGLALSGGGVRSSTFTLGVLQALAEKDRLRHIDILSTVSGGAFTGAFLGRLFLHDRVAGSGDPCGRAQDILSQNNSGPLRWLRRHANYLLANGADDAVIGVGIFFRNLFTVHFLVGALLFAVFGTLVGVSRLSLYQKLIPPPPGPAVWFTLTPSTWWWLPVALLALVIFPMKIGYWLAPKLGSYRSHPPFALAAWLVVVAGLSIALTLPGSALWAGGGLLVLGLAWLWQEAARRQLPGGNLQQRRNGGQIVRNRLSRGLGDALLALVALVGWVVLDSVAGTIARKPYLAEMVGALIALSPILQMLRNWSLRVLPQGDGPKLLTRLKITAVVLAVALLFLVDVIAHSLFLRAEFNWAWGCILFALLFSAAVGRAFDFLNLTSLHSIYAARIRRTFLGASNVARTDSDATATADVQIDHPGDDVAHDKYRPEVNGCPLHLISVCVTETVDHTSQREIRERKGVLMTLGSFGMSVGRRYFATWSSNIETPAWLSFRRWLEGTDLREQTPYSLEALRLNADANTFHPLGRRDGKPAVVQGLALSEWVAISGAAFSTGRGRATNLLESLFAGLTNVRLGYWWDSGIRATERPGRFPANVWRRLKELPGALFRVQGLLLSEWRARFDGPSREFWNLSDGGLLENTAAYELIRRRVPFIIGTDATRDLDYSMEDHANLVRLVRVDFGAEIDWIANPAALKLPPAVAAWIHLDQVGSLSELKGNPARGGPGKRYAAIARITYADNPGQITWMLVIKASLVGTESLDVTQYAHAHGDFPQDSTADQLYDDEQWESYRKLGYEAAKAVLK